MTDKVSEYRRLVLSGPECDELERWLYALPEHELKEIFDDIRWQQRERITAIFVHYSDEQLRMLYRQMQLQDPPEIEVRHGSMQIEDKTI